ncbi:hypothetical protein OCK74_27520 [Chitinophagaceae bacterium LB-8]|uniref:Uncharacterized protein n=1 Tax=Paraflavisolibacter caeni TaxID=2982496 RepID=A0A9X2Y0T2_9BACT|nr:hypothetical protein [Paraflavisolibacter caeni]MCU7552900.1 hypothetical protein [Paraflavisolibacter caeni]
MNFRLWYNVGLLFMFKPFYYYTDCKYTTGNALRLCWYAALVLCCSVPTNNALGVVGEAMNKTQQECKSVVFSLRTVFIQLVGTPNAHSSAIYQQGGKT